MINSPGSRSYPSTSRVYAHVLRQFINYLFAQAAFDGSALMASGICQFVQTEIKCVPGGKGIVSSLRTFLRFLVSGRARLSITDPSDPSRAPLVLCQASPYDLGWAPQWVVGAWKERSAGELPSLHLSAT